MSRYREPGKAQDRFQLYGDQVVAELQKTDYEKQAAIEVLQRYEAQFRELMDFLDPLPTSGDRKKQAQEMMKNLKEQLQAEVKGRKTWDSKSYAYSVYHAFQEISARLDVRWNTVPSREWFDTVWDGHDSLKIAISQLERMD